MLNGRPKRLVQEQGLQVQPGSVSIGRSHLALHWLPPSFLHGHSILKARVHNICCRLSLILALGSILLNGLFIYRAEVGTPRQAD